MDSEYGDPDSNPKDFKNLYQYSPLHNIRKNQSYPNTLVMTADTEDRVVPAHAKKFVKSLEEKANNPKDIYLWVEKKAGHGVGKPTSKLIDESADKLTFLFRNC
ncbi:prolyl oligopeptidase family serine peptidase [Natranaerobius trueperi]|uniref:prolyl oligopeptidase n=1 Tax=Natranaerobius trueperi TaxID=759412 RepID=A0A226BZZ1_9FIRM|nr:prolyl oligopeptidase family serine peptidase [Natranaerobius trueperi]OWZ83759.1 hypothetical protein CDO51_06605 [Natranaerobius trueperi]